MAKTHNPETVHPPVSTYSHAIEVPPNARWLAVAGQVAMDTHGRIPEGFLAQCELAWTNLRHVLQSAGMCFEDVVKLNIYLIREEDLPAFREVRDRFLGEARPPSTLLFVRALARPEWLIEIEAMAAKA